MSKEVIIVLGTKNAHKIREIMEIWLESKLPGLRIKLIPLHKYPYAPEVKETGRTYRANAIKKAATWAKYTGAPVLAEDSGLEVSWLNGRPGIYSARYASLGGKADVVYKDNNYKLLAELKGVPASKRMAYYRCVAAVVSPSGKVMALSEGVCRGRIALHPAGRNGFGYDPVFIPDLLGDFARYRLGYTFAQLPGRIKKSISHRSIALRKIFGRISEIIDQ